MHLARPPCALPTAHYIAKEPMSCRASMGAVGSPVLRSRALALPIRWSVVPTHGCGLDAAASHAFTTTTLQPCATIATRIGLAPRPLQWRARVRLVDLCFDACTEPSDGETWITTLHSGTLPHAPSGATSAPLSESKSDDPCSLHARRASHEIFASMMATSCLSVPLSLLHDNSGRSSLSRKSF